MTAVEPRPEARHVRGNVPAWPTAGAWRVRYSRILAVTDVVAIGTAIGLAYLLRLADFPWFENSTNVVWSLGFSVFLAVSWMGGLTIGQSRNPAIIGSGSEEYRQVLRATVLVFGGIGLLSLMVKVQLSRSYVMLVLPAGLVLLLAFRWMVRSAIGRARVKNGHYVTPMIVVGSVRAVKQLCASLSRIPRAEYRVVGVCVPRKYSKPYVTIPGIGDVPNFGNESNVADAVIATGSQAVAVTATDRLVGTDLGALSWELERLDVDLLVAPGMIDVAGQRLHMRPIAALPLIHVEKPQYLGAKRFKKSLYDVVFSSLVLVLGLPVFLLIAAAVKLTSKGPVFYRQERIGMDGRPFQMLKFRTMVEGADTMITDLTDLDLTASPRDPFKFTNDPRVTPLGRFLRKYSLDELPQFINVIKGDMSVVGPRPQVASEVECYDDHARRRLLVRPGITGMWQVSGRSDLSWEDSLRLDLFYVENWSMTADLFIGLKTLKAILRPNGAY